MMRAWSIVIIMLTRLFHFLRRPAIWIVREISGENGQPQKALPAFTTLADITDYARDRFVYRIDSIGLFGHALKLDWITDPLVFQAKLNEAITPDGDCDDYHAWVCACALRVPHVKRASLLTAIYATGGHAVSLIEFDDGSLTMINYQTHTPVLSVKHAANLVAKWGTRDAQATAKRWLVEDWPSLKLTASGW